MNEIFVLLTLLWSTNAFVPPSGLCSFDLPSYTGGWYELNTADYVRNTIETDCDCPVAYYTLNSTNSSVLDVTNSCIRNGVFTSISGSASPVAGFPPSNLHVDITSTSEDRSFRANVPTSTDGATSPNYIVVQQWSSDDTSLAPQYALVGGQTENLWWFLGRSPNTNVTIWNYAAHLLQGYGYNVTNYAISSQDCQFLGGHGRNLIPPPEQSL